MNELLEALSNYITVEQSQKQYKCECSMMYLCEKHKVLKGVEIPLELALAKYIDARIYKAIAYLGEGMAR